MMSNFTCPYLGRADDRETAFAFSSPGHRCYRLKEPSNITISHQTAYCLTDEYTRCPVFALASMLEPDESQALQVKDEGETSAPEFNPEFPLPAVDFRQKFAHSLSSLQGFIARFFKIAPDRNPAIPAMLATAITILLITVLIFGVVAITSLTSPRIEATPDLMLTALAEESQPNIFLVTITPTMRSAFIQKMGSAAANQGFPLAQMEEQNREPSPITIIVTATFEPTQTVPVTFACGAPSDWSSYTVQPGDSLTGLSVEYNISLLELSSNNCKNTTDNLFTGEQIYVPSNKP